MSRRPLASEATVLGGDCRAVLPTLPAESFQCCVTSPPYWGLRDYEHPSQVGLEATIDAYVGALVDVFRHVRRVLRKDGTLWVNIGDSYVSGTKNSRRELREVDPKRRYRKNAKRPVAVELAEKNLLGLPWLVAFALRADGWTLRSALVWKKPNGLPESVKDRPTLDYEHVFLFARSETYYFDAAAIRERAMWGNHWRREVPIHSHVPGRPAHTGLSIQQTPTEGRNARSIWEIPLDKKPGEHKARFPIELPRRCILAGSQRGDRILDPFAGSGTTGRAAVELGRSATLIELNPEEADKARHRGAQLGL